MKINVNSMISTELYIITEVEIKNTEQCLVPDMIVLAGIATRPNCLSHTTLIKYTYKLYQEMLGS